MGKYIDRKLAGSKRSKMPDSLKGIKRQRKRLDHQKSQIDALTGTVDKDISSEEDDASMQLPVYDNLLRALGSGRDALEDYFRNKSAKNQGDIRIPYTVDAVYKSASTLAEEGVGEDSESDQSAQFGNEIIEGGGGKISTHGDELYDQDYMPDSQFNVNSSSDESANNISFHRHFGHVLTNEEVNKLTKESLKFKWEMLVKEMPMSKLVGTGQELSIDLNGDHFCRINQKLHNHWKNLSSNFNSDDVRFSKMRLFFSLCNSYRNIMHCDKRPFYMKGRDDDDDSVIMDAYIMHALNHVHRIRDLVLKHNAKLSKYDNSKSEENSIHCGDIYLDQGFTRPKVLLLFPLASIAFRVVKRLIQLYPLSHKGNVAHMDRFSEEFGADDVEGSLKSTKQEKPVDFEVLFGGNNNDHFMIGIKFTKGSIKLYNNFYLSDIIVASPLGLITKIGEMEIDKEKNVDYLSSIEVLIIDHADIVAMQNWFHLSTVVEHLNRMPSQQHGTDVMRIKQWYLNGHARFYRQTILLGSFLTPDMNALFNRLCVNYEGKVKMVSQHKGVLHRVLLQARQLFERFEASSIIDADDARLEYFSNKVFPKMKDSIEGRTLIFISSYFEFVRIRNFLKSQNASFCLLSEYTKQSDVSRSRLWFFEGKRKMMLYTERAHFYHRYKIRGIRNLIFYSLPERKEFYSDIVNMLEGSEHMPCSVLFSRYDLYRLERIVGTAAANRMSSSDKTTFIFC